MTRGPCCHPAKGGPPDTINNPATMQNIGEGVPAYVDTTSEPFEVRSFTSSDESVTIELSDDESEIDIRVTPSPPPAQSNSFILKSPSVFQTNATSFQVAYTTPALADVLNGENWIFDLGVKICHPLNVQTINTEVLWQLETAPNTWIEIERWSVNTGISLTGSQQSIPYRYPSDELTMSMDNPRIRLLVRMTGFILALTVVERVVVWGISR